LGIRDCYNEILENSNGVSLKQEEVKKIIIICAPMVNAQDLE
jgi:hypothetical protein